MKPLFVAVFSALLLAFTGCSDRYGGVRTSGWYREQEQWVETNTAKLIRLQRYAIWAGTVESVSTNSWPTNTISVAVALSPVKLIVGERDRAGERDRLFDVEEPEREQHNHGQFAVELRFRPRVDGNQREGRFRFESTSAGIAKADFEHQDRADDRCDVYRL